MSFYLDIAISCIFLLITILSIVCFISTKSIYIKMICMFIGLFSMVTYSLMQTRIQLKQIKEEIINEIKDTSDREIYKLTIKKEEYENTISKQ